MSKLTTIEIESPVSAVTESWESLGEWLKVQWPEMRAQYFKNSMAIGCAILRFSERPEILSEVQKANEDRRGRRWTPVNYVAKMLSEKYGSALPTAKHLGNCARAAEIALEKYGPKGLNGSEGMRALLNWKAPVRFKIDPENIPEVNPEALALSLSENSATKHAQKKATAENQERLSPEAFRAGYVELFKRFAREAEQLIEKRPDEPVKFSRPEREAIANSAADAHVFLKLSGYEVSGEHCGPIQKGDK